MSIILNLILDQNFRCHISDFVSNEAQFDNLRQLSYLF